MTKNINRVSDLTDFMKTWDGGGVSSGDAKVVRGPYGNINFTGKPNDTSWNIVKDDHRFDNFIEPGVLDLVQVIANHLELVTYTSCEGHLYNDGELDADRRHVGIAPRNLVEAGLIWRNLEPLCTKLSDEVEARIEVTTLDDNFRCYLTFLIVFNPLLSWDQYFSVLDDHYSIFIDKLLRLPAIGINVTDS